MTTFILACAGLLLLSSLFFLFPRVRPGAAEDDLDRANMEWFRLRRAELDGEGNAALQEDAQLRLLEDEHRHAAPPAPAQQSFPVWILLPFVTLLASGLYYVLGAAPDVVIVGQLQSMQDDTPPEQMRSLIRDVEARSAQRPDNLHYLALLGRYYMAQEDYARAAQSYGALVEAVPEDAQALAYAAQAEYLAAGRTLSDRARLRAEQALAADPQQRTALGLLGMASFEQQQYRAAMAYWQRLQVMEPPDSDSAKMITQVIETARQRLIAEDPSAADAIDAAGPQQPVAATGAGVTVRVSVPADADIGPADTVFILARNAQSGSRMPIAVQRLTGAQLPVTLRLDDSNSMAGQKLSQTASVIVAVQVSPDGRPGEDNARWLGQVGPVAPRVDDAPLEIALHLKDAPPGTALASAEAPAEVDHPEGASSGVTVRVAAPTDADIGPADTVFVLARNADSGSRMPIAVQRLTGAQLPVTLRLDDSNSMAGQKLSQTASVIVAVQVSPDGRPGEENARWLGQVGPVVPAVDTTPLDIVLRPNKQ